MFRSDPLVDFSVTVGEAHGALKIVVSAGDIWPAVVVEGVHLQKTVIEVAHVLIQEDDRVRGSKWGDNIAQFVIDLVTRVIHVPDVNGAHLALHRDGANALPIVGGAVESGRTSS